MGVFFIIVMVLLSALHLYCCFINKAGLRKITKVFLMPVLIGVYYFNAADPQLFVILALIFGTLGDILLIFTDSPKLFIYGLSSFGVGHICYVIAFIPRMGAVSPFIAIFAVLAFIGAGLMLLKMLKPYAPDNMKIMMRSYVVLISAMSLCAILRFAAAPSVYAGVAAVGSLLFLASDSILSFEIFKGETKYGNFIVMLTYILAQSALAVGFIF